MEPLVSARYDPETGLPLDKSYLETGLSKRITDAIAVVEDRYRRMEAGERLPHFGLDYDEPVSELTIAEAEGEISYRQARYLQEKYL